MTQPQQDLPYANTPQPLPPVHLLSEEHTPDDPVVTRLHPPPPPTARPLIHGIEEELAHRAAWRAGMLGAINVLALVLAVRWTVMMSVAGAIILALQTMAAPTDWYKLGVLGIYCAAVVGPLVWLSSRRE